MAKAGGVFGNAGIANYEKAETDACKITSNIPSDGFVDGKDYTFTVSTNLPAGLGMVWKVECSECDEHATGKGNSGQARKKTQEVAWKATGNGVSAHAICGAMGGYDKIHAAASVTVEKAKPSAGETGKAGGATTAAAAVVTNATTAATAVVTNATTGGTTAANSGGNTFRVIGKVAAGPAAKAMVIAMTVANCDKMTAAESGANVAVLGAQAGGSLIDLPRSNGKCGTANHHRLASRDTFTAMLVFKANVPEAEVARTMQAVNDVIAAGQLKVDFKVGGVAERLTVPKDCRAMTLVCARSGGAVANFASVSETGDITLMVEPGDNDTCQYDCENPCSHFSHPDDTVRQCSGCSVNGLPKIVVDALGRERQAAGHDNGISFTAAVCKPGAEGYGVYVASTAVSTANLAAIAGTTAAAGNTTAAGNTAAATVTAETTAVAEATTEEVSSASTVAVGFSAAAAVAVAQLC